MMSSSRTVKVIDLRRGITAKVTHKFSATSKEAAKDTESKTTCSSAENAPVERRVATIGVSRMAAASHCEGVVDQSNREAAAKPSD